jgi:hypothetical protein
MKRTSTLSAAAALLFVATAAQAQRGQDDRRDRQGQHSPASPQDQQHAGGNQRGAESQASGIDRARENQARDNQARAEQARAAEEQNQRRAAQQSEQLREQQRRQAQQQDELARAQRAEQEARLQRDRQARASRAYDRDRDDRPGYNYRYNVRGVYRETNQYGVDVLRQSVNQGYERGYRAGSIDRRDGAPADFQRALGFETDGFGYSGAYVPQGDYSYYFGEGFQRGYDDAYWNRSQYGTFSNGKAGILGAIAAGILGLTMIR